MTAITVHTATGLSSVFEIPFISLTKMSSYGFIYLLR